MVYSIFIVNANQNCDFLNHIQVMNPTIPSKLQWVMPQVMQKSWNNIIVCDIWGVSVPWKSIGNISHRCRNRDEEGDVMLPTGYPSNRALFAAFNDNDYGNIIATGHFCVGKGVMFQKWSLETSIIPAQAVKGKRWICI